MIIGSGGKKVRSIIEETGVEAIDTDDDGIVRQWKTLSLIGPFSHIANQNVLFCLCQVKITAKDLSSLEKSKSIISNLVMVPTVGDIYRYFFSVRWSFFFFFTVYPSWYWFRSRGIKVEMAMFLKTLADCTKGEYNDSHMVKGLAD